MYPTGKIRLDSAKTIFHDWTFTENFVNGSDRPVSYTANKDEVTLEHRYLTNLCVDIYNHVSK